MKYHCRGGMASQPDAYLLVFFVSKQIYCALSGIVIWKQKYQRIRFGDTELLHLSVCGIQDATDLFQKKGY